MLTLSCNVLRRTCFFPLLGCLLPALAQTLPVSWRSDHGDELSYDGAFYSFRSADEKSAFKIWIPPTEAPLRGLLLFGNPGGGYGGDTRNKTKQADMLTFAVRHNLAVGGVTGFPGRDTFAEQGVYVLRGLKAMGDKGFHPELAEIPMIFSGGSNAGFFSYSMASLAPERTIAITPNVGGYFSTDSDPALQQVPMWIHIGALDPLVSDGVEKTEELFRKASLDGVPFWTWDAEMKGHENGAADHVDMAFWDAMLKARLPEKTVDEGPVSLVPLKFESGWITDLRSWDHRITRIFPAAELHGSPEPGRFGWMANEGLARLYQATATRSRPILLSLEQPAPDQPGAGTGGVYLSAGLSTIVDPGEEIVLKLNNVPLSFGLETIEIWDRDEKLGEVNYGDGEDRFKFTVDGSKLVYALYAYAKVDRWGTVSERISAPLQLVVRDPVLSDKVARQLEDYGYLPVAKRSAREPQAVDAGLTPLPEAESLRSVKISGDVKPPTQDGALTAVWETAGDAMVIDSSFAVGRGETKSTIRVRSLWSEAGLYFLYEVEDDTLPEAEAQRQDTIDFHLAAVDPASLFSETDALREHYSRPEANALLLGAAQMQIPMGKTAGKGLHVNYWDPFDWQRAELYADNSFGGSGMWLDVVAVDGDERVMEMFIPWAFVGMPGLSRAPVPGSRLSFVLMYADSNSGSTLIWPRKKNPWAVRPKAGETSPFGQILFTSP